MSVINQMLRDLDARGQGDAALRRAAMASVGQPVAHRRPGSRWRRLWWGVAVACVALALAALGLVANRWKAIERVAEAGAAADIAISPVAEPDAPIEPKARAVAPPPQPAEVVPATIPAAVPDRPAAPQAPPAAVAAEPEPESLPPPAAAPAARATIERVAREVDPLDAARVALAEGRADAALAALAVQPQAGAERDALEAAALQQLGRHGEAEQAYRRALQREPDIGAWWAGLGISLDAGGRGDEALAAFREAQRRGPLDPALADYLGERVEALSAGEPSR